MKKYILLLIFSFMVFHCQISCAQTIDKDILADEDLMKTITLEQLDDYISKGADVNAKGRDLVNILMGKDLELMKAVINVKSDQETKDLGNSDISPVMYALKGGNFEVIQKLLDNGADVNAHDSAGNTVLIYACRFKADENIIKMLVKYGANVNARDNNWKSVLMYACQNDNVEILKILVQAGANVNAKMEDGTTALIIAAQENPNIEITKFLLDNGADINARVMLKAVHKISTTAKNIRKKQKAIKATTNLGVDEVASKAASLYAKTKGIFVDDNSIKEEMDNVADKIGGVEQIYNNAMGKTVLMVAGDNKNPEIISFLLNYNIDINAQGPFGMTALMYACDSKTSSDVSGIKTLLEHGAETQTVNEYGETALDYLKDNDLKKENPEYWDVFELYNQISESGNQVIDNKNNVDLKKDEPEETSKDDDMW